MQAFAVVLRFGFLASVGLTILLPGVAQQPSKPYKVNIVGEKDSVAAGVLPVDLKVRIAFQYQGNLNYRAQAEGKRITDSADTLFMIDGNILQAAQPIRQELQPLPTRPTGVKPYGGRTVWERNGVRVTMTLEAVPGKRYQPKPTGPVARRMDTLLVRYSVENTSQAARKFGLRAVVSNGAIKEPGLTYYSPTTHPKETLLGVTLEKKEVPSFLEALERDNIQNPGFKGTFTFKFGDRLEGPGKVVLTRVGLVTPNEWDIAAERGAESVCVLYWEPRTLPPQGKRELAYAYGQGIAMTNEGTVSAEFGGSFTPGKTFTVTAYVLGPLDGQNLTLQLPQGMELVAGRATQIVPLEADAGQSVVMWRCRLLQAGTFPIAIRSNNGITQTWTVTVSPPD